jgi:hypothetical protein
MSSIATEDKVLVIKRITVRYRLAVRADEREEAEHVHGFQPRSCPVARSLEGGIEVAHGARAGLTPPIVNTWRELSSARRRAYYFLRAR